MGGILFLLNKINQKNMEENTTPQIPIPAAPSYAVPFAIVIAGVAIAAAIYFGDGNKGAIAAQAPKADLAPVTGSDHILGNPNAKVVIVEYSDTECPFCKSFHPTMQRIIGEYGDSGTVAWVYRHYPLPRHSKAPKEAEATECAGKIGGNTKFWEYTKKLFETTLGNDQLDTKELPKIATAIGIDEAAFNSCLASGEMKARVDADTASGNKAGVRGTPHSIILVKGKIVDTIDGAQSYENVKAQIEEALK